MSDLFRIIGATIFSIVMYAIPILCTLSFVYNWGEEVQIPLFFLSLGQLICIIDRYIRKED